MSVTIYNTGYEAFLTGCASAFIAQVLKLIIDLIKNRRFNFKVFTATGGMPSSHSAGVMALTTAVGFIDGFNSTLFAVSFGMSLVVMYDAAGVRRSAGKISICLNKMMEDFYKQDIQAAGGKLKEILGHTPVEVYAGATLGVIFAYIVHFVIF